MLSFVVLFALGGAALFIALTHMQEFALFGALTGALLGYLFGLGSRLRRLERRCEDLAARLVRRVSAEKAVGSPADTAAAAAQSTAAQAPPRQETAADAESAWAASAPPPGDERLELDLDVSRLAGEAGRLDTWTRDALSRLRAFVLRGNPVVQVGVVVLFFGVAFLVKYAAERDLLPIELRLSLVALGGLVMLGVGWRLRSRAEVYAMVLQGGGAGVLYLTVYAAAKLYSLLPPALALAVMVGLVALSGALAVLQNALALALFATAGGFLAPVLASTGSGSHVTLFSYYALLNAGILGIAWFRSWRLLNLTGFAFTFVIGGLWGYRYYRPEYFATTEPFLILFFLCYLTIAVLFAYRQPPRLAGYVDGSLVFGVPLVAFGLQAALVKDFEYGLAFGALALGAVYTGAATLAWRRGPPHMRLLAEAFLALGIVFASLAIPFALDGRWTAAAWAVEGAAMLWIGVRQGRWPARGFGVLLQYGAGVAFLAHPGPWPRELPVFNGAYLGAVAVGLSGLFCAWYLERNHEHVREWERKLELPLLIWGLVWWLGSGVNEIGWQLRGRVESDAVIVFLAGSGLLMGWLHQRLPWPRLAWPALGLLPLLCLAAITEFASSGFYHPLGGWGAIAWPLSLAAGYRLLWRLEPAWPQVVVRIWHPLGLWLVLFLVSWELDWILQRAVQGAATWRYIAWALVPGLAVAFLWRFGERLTWPVGRHFVAYSVIGLGPLALYLLCWVLLACLIPGRADPLPYVPLLSPLDLAQAFALAAAARWCLWLSRAAQRPDWWPANTVWLAALSAATFVWMNTLVARTVHFWAGVSYSIPGLHHSVVFHAAVSVLWTLTASAVMALSRARNSRTLWFTGAGLLAAVVLKLFLVDLAGIGTMARIISFLAVGGMMLVIGYFAPLPPRQPAPEGGTP